MSSKEFDPDRLDVEAFAKAGASLAGRWPLKHLPRLSESAVAEALDPGAEVEFAARGEARPARAGAPEVWLHLRASATVPLQCQRCLAPVSVPLEVERDFRFVHGEDAAAQLDADSEDDVLALTRALDLAELTEDELLLSMPIVPRHEVCPDPLQAPPEVGQLEDDEAPHPFAALAGLKKPSLPN